MSQTFLDVLRHLISCETFQREICKIFQKKNSSYFCGFQTSEKYVKWFTNDQIVHKLFANFTNYHGVVPVLALLHAAVVPHQPRGRQPRHPLGPRRGRCLPHELDDATDALHPGSELEANR